MAPLYDLLSTVVWPDLSPGFAMKIARRATLDELRRGDWDRFVGSAGLAAPFVRRRVRELADLAVTRAPAAAGELAGRGLDEEVLAGFAERVTRCARRLATTV